MPYIAKEQRWLIYSKGVANPESAGELNYCLTQLCLDYLDTHWKTREKYEAINQVIGALECAKLEFYRRLAAPYEDKKIKENGDVYE